MDFDPGIDLTPFGGADCFGYTNANLGAFMAPITAGTANFMVAVPNNTALIGAELSVQGTAAAAGIPSGFSTSNGLRGIVGL
ncbi:MAG: hypothetical protein AB8H80_21100 [Planctomycetota bacterium]